MKRLQPPRLARPSAKAIEGGLVTIGFFGGLALCASAVALVYLPAGLFFAGAAMTVLAGLYAWKTPETPA